MQSPLRWNISLSTVMNDCASMGAVAGLKSLVE